MSNTAAGDTRFSIIVPARNAEATVERTLDSVRSQTHQGWEVVVVDDGSTDGTAPLVRDLAARDPRVRLLTGTGTGVSTARNLGVAAARHPWLLFLDADDWIAPTMLARVAGSLRADPTLDGVRCVGVDVAFDGRQRRASTVEPGVELFPETARTCPFMIHAVVVRRDLVESVGGFDPDLVAAEDWDLWQRLARCGARLGQVAEELAFYQMRPGSTMRSRYDRMLDDCLTVVGRGHRADPRVAHPADGYADGVDPAGLGVARQNLILWVAGLAVAGGVDPVPLLARLGEGPISVDPASVAYNLFDAVPLGAGLLPDDWSQLWPPVADRVGVLLDAIGQRATAPLLAPRALRHLERLAVLAAPGPHLVVVGVTAGLDLEVDGPLGELVVPPGVERVVVRLRHGGRRLGPVELPVLEAGRLTAHQVRRAVAEDRGALLIASAVLARRHRPAALPLRPLVRSLPVDAALGLVRGLRWETGAPAVAGALTQLAATRAVAGSGWLGPVPPGPDRAAAPPPASPAGRAGGGTYRVPILMYHRVAADGPADLAPYRVHPEVFEGQLDHLRRQGYRSTTFAEWRAARAAGRPLPGRPVLLTFDDGYRDFATEAFPLLRRYGFGATVFLVVDRVGQASSWDARYGEPSPLMDWDEIRALAAQDVEFGSHTLRHDPQTGVPVAELVGAERTARRTMAAELGAAVTTVCYPYGDMDPVVQRAMAAAGHDVGVSCREGVATVWDPPMALPRLDVPGSLDQAGFAWLLDTADARPNLRHSLGRLRRAGAKVGPALAKVRR